MDVLVSYDLEGTIQKIEGGSELKDPVGIPFLKVNIPEGKKLERVDVTVIPNEPVFIDLPKSDIEKLQEGLNVSKQDNTDVSEIILDLGIRVQMLEGGM